MMIIRAVIATNLVAAALLAFGNFAMAKEQSAQTRELQPCKIHERNVRDCHIHDLNTYLHLNSSDARKAGPHADEEYRALRRWHEQQQHN
ncbi:MAG: hypothetical protein QGF20_14735 [Alphaproteobacteria bacterium]|jgi:hypothetical protein|nr:hypothetical protein [Alphaproteobacteria bacterium]